VSRAFLKDNDSDIDRAQYTELIRFFEESILALKGGGTKISVCQAFLVAKIAKS
jgi:hypothetical protein